VHLLQEEEKTVAEGAGALGVAGLLEHQASFKGARVGAIVSGGNIDTGLLACIVSCSAHGKGASYGYAQGSSTFRWPCERLANAVALHGANILDVWHQRVFLIS
jgi:threonine dehydratase